MKKILFLLLIFIIKLNAYEYKVYDYHSQDRFYYDLNNDFLSMKVVYKESSTPPSVYSPSSSVFWSTLNAIHVQKTDNIYISKTTFIDILKNDTLFLNDFYLQATQQILNFFYNDSGFSVNNHIEYEDYQILYDSNGMAVESIVNGVWAGLYSDSERGSSGKLYNSSGVLVYVNAEPVNTFQQWLDPLVRSVVGCLMTAVNLVASPIGVVISVVFVMAILYFVVWLGRKSLRVKDGF